MNTETATYAYVDSTSHSFHTAPWNRVEIIKQSPAKITAKFSHTGAVEMVFTKRSDGTFVQSGKDIYRPRTLNLDLAKCEADNAKQKAASALRHKKNEVCDAILKAVAGQKNGYGDYCLDEAELARFEQALAVLTAK